MSGPATTADDAGEAGATGSTTSSELEVLDSRTASVGPLTVQRALPQRTRRTVGAWCFVDHAGPVDDASAGSGIGPHPHIGLQTVTWVLSGEMVHRDSLGSEQRIRPGELNLMTAGRGIVHAEENLGTSPVHLAQLWVAQPAVSRDGPPAFEHHDDLPQLELGDAVATVLVGGLGGIGSPARRDTDHVGADVDLRSHATIPLQATHEHAVIPLVGVVEVDGRALGPAQLAYLAPGRDEVALQSPDGARLMLLGGVPFDEPILMWWNYVARTRDEISAAHAAWTSRSDRFGIPPSSLSPIDVDPPPWTHR